MSKTTTNEQRDIDIALIRQSTENIEKRVDSIDLKLEKNYVTQDQFDPIRRLVYGLVGLILVGVVTAVLALILQR